MVMRNAAEGIMSNAELLDVLYAPVESSIPVSDDPEMEALRKESIRQRQRTRVLLNILARPVHEQLALIAMIFGGGGGDDDANENDDGSLGLGLLFGTDDESDL